MKVFTKGYFRRLFLIFTLCLLIAGCSSEKEYKFTFNRKDGETYIQKLSVSRERHMGSTDIQTDDTLSETRVTCRKTKNGWDIIAQPLNRIIMRNGKEVKNPLLAQLSKFKITYKLDKDGELKDVTGYEKMEETIKSKYPAKVVQGLSAVLDIDALKQKEFSEWNGRIGNFINKEFSIGDVWEDDVPYRLPNGAKLNYKVKTNFKKQVEYNGVKCVLIEQTYDSTGGGITDSVKDIAESVSTKEGNKKGVSLNAGKVSSSIKGKVSRLIDPATMNIYKEDDERTITMEMDMPGAGMIPVKIIESRTYTYDYGR